jgi:hypothetical protein
MQIVSVSSGALQIVGFVDSTRRYRVAPAKSSLNRATCLFGTTSYPWTMWQDNAGGARPVVLCWTARRTAA